jgi:nucleoside 2-deoxyribosyltransferase
MKIQLAYRFTGENQQELTEILKQITKILENSGHQVYCPILDPNRPSEKKELFIGTINKIKETDSLLAIIKTSDKSEGMLMEIGAAFALNKKVIIAIKKDVKDTHLKDLSNQIIEFNDIKELCDELKNIKI